MQNCELVMTVQDMEADRAKWLQARQSGCGGSEIAAILGMGAWGDPYSVWSRKIKGNTEDDLEEHSDNEIMEFGREMEDFVARKLAEEKGFKLRKCGLMRRIDKPWMLASVDRLVVGSETDGSGGIGVEVKTGRDDWEEGSLPVQYYWQCLWYMACTGYQKWIAVYMNRVSCKRVIREIERTPEIEADIKYMEEKVEDFWNNYVIPKKLPPVVNGSEHCTHAIIGQFPGEFGEKGTNVMELDGQYENMLNDIAKLEEDVAKIQENIDKKKNEIRLHMENMTFAHAGIWNISFKPMQTTRVDSKKLKERYPNIYEECSRTSSSRPFKITVSKDPKRVG